MVRILNQSVSKGAQGSGGIGNTIGTQQDGIGDKGVQNGGFGVQRHSRETREHRRVQVSAGGVRGVVQGVKGFRTQQRGTVRHKGAHEGV